MLRADGRDAQKNPRAVSSRVLAELGLRSTSATRRQLQTDQPDDLSIFPTFGNLSPRAAQALNCLMNIIIVETTRKV